MRQSEFKTPIHHASHNLKEQIQKQYNVYDLFFKQDLNFVKIYKMLYTIHCTNIACFSTDRLEVN